MTMEIWKDIIGYEGVYQVSNNGSVRRVYNTNGIIRYKTKSLKYSNKGYARVGLSLNGYCKYFLLHRLVAIAFIPNPNGYAIINHIDGNKTNNSISNLEWCTYSMNTKHAYAIGLEKHEGRNKKKISVFKDGILVCVYDSIHDMCKSLHFDRGTFLKNRRTKQEKYREYEFEYEH